MLTIKILLRFFLTWILFFIGVEIMAVCMDLEFKEIVLFGDGTGFRLYVVMFLLGMWTVTFSNATDIDKLQKENERVKKKMGELKED